MAEAVDHPAHYGGADNPYEVIKVLEAWLTRDEFIGFLKGNVIKYQARAKNGGEDYAKAAWYANYLGEFLKRSPEPEKVDGAVSRQLSRSMELNAKIKNEVRRICNEATPGVTDLEWIRSNLEAVLRMS